MIMTVTCFVSAVPMSHFMIFGMSLNFSVL